MIGSRVDLPLLLLRRESSSPPPPPTDELFSFRVAKIRIHNGKKYSATPKASLGYLMGHGAKFSAPPTTAASTRPLQRSS